MTIIANRSDNCHEEGKHFYNLWLFHLFTIWYLQIKIYLKNSVCSTVMVSLTNAYAQLGAYLHCVIRIGAVYSHIHVLLHRFLFQIFDHVEFDLEINQSGLT